jgi:hypothetical protein
MMLPAPTVVVVSSLSRPVSPLSWFCELFRRLSRLLSSGLPLTARASRPLIPVSVVVSCLTFAVSVLICWSRPLCAVSCRLRRYASANACDPACASCGVPAVNVITRTVVFAGTSTETSLARSIGERAVRSSVAALAATAPERTSCASVSRLTVPLVRPPCAFVSWSSDCTSTAADDSYVLGSALVSAVPAPRPAPVAISAIHQWRRKMPR